MKVKHNNPTPEFQPIELTITIESEEEFAELYRKSALDRGELAMADGTNHLKSFNGMSSSEDSKLFDALYEIASERGYIK